MLNDLQTFPDTHLTLLIYKLVNIPCWCVKAGVGVLLHVAHEFLSLRKHKDKDVGQCDKECVLA
jgi:hypothetical protein